MVFPDLKRWRRGRGSARRAAHRNLDRGTARALVELSRTIGTEPWDTSVRRIVKLDAELFEVERVSFWSYQEQTASIHCEAGYVTSLRTFEHGATLCRPQLPDYFEAMLTERVINMPDVKTNPRARGLRDYCASRDIASMLDVPVWVSGRLAGVLCHEHVGSVRAWTPHEEDFAFSVGQIAAAALEARARVEADAASRRAAFLDTLSCKLYSQDSGEVAQGAVDLCVPNHAELAVVWLHSPEGGMECKAMKHADPAKDDFFRRQARELAPHWRRQAPEMAGRSASQGQSLLIPELGAEVLERYGVGPRSRSLLLGLGMRTAMFVPLGAPRRTLGTMTFFASDRTYGAEDLSLAEKITSRVATALENARLYELARDAIRARDELLVLAAHELRTPLTALQLTTEQILRQVRRRAEAPEAARTDKLAQQVRRFSGVVERVLEAMRIRAEGVSLSLGPCDLARILRERIALVDDRARADGSPITVSCPAEVPGRCDRERLRSAIDELLDNALKFGRGRPIEVTLTIEGTCADLCVTDHGIGFSPEGLAALFDPFVRAVPAEHFGGLGLGLYVAKAVVEAHGGSITATSRPGEGATFRVRIPLGRRR